MATLISQCKGNNREDTRGTRTVEGTDVKKNSSRLPIFAPHHRSSGSSSTFFIVFSVFSSSYYSLSLPPVNSTLSLCALSSLFFPDSLTSYPVHKLKSYIISAGDFSNHRGHPQVGTVHIPSIRIYLVQVHNYS